MVKVGINGYGRIGRTLLRASLGKDGVEVVAVNESDLSISLDLMVYLFKYDSGPELFKGSVEAKNGQLFVNNKPIALFREKNPQNIKWGSVMVDCVLDTKFSSSANIEDQAAELHLKGGAKKVIIAGPSDRVPTFIPGVNLDKYDPSYPVIAAGTPSAHAIAPLAKVLNDKFSIVGGSITTIRGANTTEDKFGFGGSITTTHAANAMDGTHVSSSPNDWRSRRSINNTSIVPSSSKAAYDLAKVIPSLYGKLTDLSISVPTGDVSVVILDVQLEKYARYEDIKHAFQDAANGPLKGILVYIEDDVVSTDFHGSDASTTVDASSSSVIDGHFAKLVSWYDNDWGYSNRIVELTKDMAHVQDEKRG